MGEENISIFLVFFAGLLATVLILSKYLHESKLLSSFLPEAAMILMMGMAAGYLIHLIVGKRYVVMKNNSPTAYYDYDFDDDDFNAAAAYAYEDDLAAYTGGNDDGAGSNHNNNDNGNDGSGNGSNSNNGDDEVDLAALLSFDSDIFFVILLPPIIFNTGLRIGPLFFRHIVPIVMFAVIGTTISAVSTALLLYGVVQAGLVDFNPSLAELLTFGALISSTDPVSTLAVFKVKKVDPQLFYLCFGESVLNDALAIVLFYSFGKFVSTDVVNGYDATLAVGQFFIDLFLNSVGSLILGCTGGMIAAFIFKQIEMRNNRLVEISVYVLLMYIPFLIAEILQVSGIVTILFTGISANRYVVPNLSNITKVNADMIFRLGAHLAETAIFLELGLSVFGVIGHWNWSFIGWSLLACFVGRAMNVYPLSFIYNICLLKHMTPSLTSANTTYWDVFKRRTSRKSVRNHDLSEILHKTQDSRRATFENPGLMRTSTTPDAQQLKNLSPPTLPFRQPPTFASVNASNNPETEWNAAAAFGPPTEQILGNRAMSFGDQSCTTEATATPWERKDLKIRMNTANMLWFSGLRGAVAYACVRTFPNELGHRKDFAMTSMAIILITTFVLGTTTPLALQFFGIDIDVDEKKYMEEELREPIISNWILTVEKRRIKPYVIRDFSIMESIRGDVQRAREMATSPMPRREPLHIEPKIEMTVSGYLDAVSDVGTMEPINDDGSLERLVRTDSLFDYGAY
jgi:sodium/hydrogen exchanger 8